GAGARKPRDIQPGALPTPRRKAERVPIVGPPRPPVRTGIAVGVGLAVIVSVIAIGLLALELLPSATITLNPRSQALGPIDMTVEASEDVTVPDAASLAIPARRFTFPVEASQTFPATGVHVELVNATGTVTFSNFDTGRAIRVEEGVVLSTEDDIEFRTLDTITLPNATIQFPFTIVPSTRDVAVEAVEAGPDGNVGNNTITEVPKGVNRRLLRVTNVEATSGGARAESPEVTKEDVEAAKSALVAALTAELDRKVAANEGVPAGITLFPETRSVGEAQYSVDPESLVGGALAEFDLAATAEGAALGVDPAPIQAIAEARLAARVTEGWSVQPGSVTSEIGTPAVLGTTIAYPVSIRAMQVHDVDEAALLASVKGLGLPEARSRLDDFGDVAIEVWPDWVTKIPTRADRVTLNLAAPQPSAAP
ncbi:MAG TPA: baseplate J/gp47 family protein, partial [Candidatus Limnocylindrales bacterium]|nr:baseplate J/gp47 family protein [Candidatus Limnocylindrales bacterium]